MLRIHASLPFFALSALALAAPATAPAQPAAAVSAPISDVRYEVAFSAADAAARRVRVTMRFNTPGDAPAILSLPAWTPGAYEISNFARWVSGFTATADGKVLDWDKLDFDSWRIDPAGARSIAVAFSYAADSLDNAMTWARPDFLLFNGTNLFLYPEGRGFDWPATVTVHTESGWRIATGMDWKGGRSYGAGNYHDLVDMPFFVGRFDIDSMRIAERWVRFASYPERSVEGTTRKQVWEQIGRVVPPMVRIFGETPFSTYTLMQIADSSFGGASGLEHQNSHVDVISPAAIGHPFMPSLYAHEIFHAWNVKRLRPAALWPYDYDEPQPTEWLWVSEGITDYYADLAEVRGGVIDSTGFFGLTAGKIQEVASVPPVALEDASLSTWVHPEDGTGYLYYPKGSLAGLLLDIMIRDGSDNRRSLDDVMRQLYVETYKAGRGFTGADWWRAVGAAAGGKSFDDTYRRYIDGREPYPWRTILPLAGMRFVTDTLREPRLGVNTLETEQGLIVTTVDPEGAAAAAGVRAGDVLLAVGDIAVSDGGFSRRFTERFGSRPGVALPLRVRRGTETLTLEGRVRLAERYQMRIEAHSGASPKARRILGGILHGTVDR